MASISRCPSCGEGERLRGRADGDDIEVTCESCGARWLRGAQRCNGCGRDEVVMRPQVMTRQPRGNQLAIVGRRQLALCPTCDREAIADSMADNRPVPETYVSTFLFGQQVPGKQPQGSPAQPTTGSDSQRRRARRESIQPRKSSPPRTAAAKTTPPSEPTRARPTVRQAIESYLLSSPGADSLAMLFLGQHLGPATRLEALDRPEAADALSRWFAQTWGDRDGQRRDSAEDAIVGAIRNWHTEGWLSQETAERLRRALSA